MRERLIQQWQKRSALTYLLAPLTWFYRSIILLRRASYRLIPGRVQQFDAPVIVIGNITVGGSGKTPLVQHVAQLLLDNGFSPGIVSRGYGRQSSRPDPQLVDPDSDPREVGDEPLLLARQCPCPVVVDSRRTRGVLFLLDRGVNVVVSDDGLQHYAMDRDLEIAVVDGERRYGNGRCLPAGPLREPLKRLRTVDMVVCNGSKRKSEIAMRLIPTKWVNLKNSNSNRGLHDFKGQRIKAIAGIGNPDRFFGAVETLVGDCDKQAFPDHYQYKEGDLVFDQEDRVLMTEKDAVKCVNLPEVNRQPEKYWYLAVTVDIEKAFDAAILALAKREKKVG